MRYVNDGEQRFVTEIERRKILRRMNGELLADAVLCFCPDRYRRRDLVGFHKKKFEDAYGREFHPQDVKIHGGPINVVYAPEDIFPL